VAPAAVLIASLALVLAACGVSGSGSVDSATSSPSGRSGPSSSTTGGTTGAEGSGPSTAPDPDTSDQTTPDGDGPDSTLPDGVRDAMVQAFTQIGLNPTQAGCLADGYIELGVTDPNATPDYSKILGLLETCNISLSDLAELGAGG